MSDASRPSDDDRLVEADAADLDEQRTLANPQDDEPTPAVTVAPEVPAADAAEQAAEVPDDEDEEPR